MALEILAKDGIAITRATRVVIKKAGMLKMVKTFNTVKIATIKAILSP